MPDFQIIFIQTITTLFAAFLGAYAAFWLENNRRIREETKAQAASGNRAMFVLARFFNNLVLFRRDVIEPVRGNPAAMIGMRAVTEMTDENLSIDIDALQFVIDKKDTELLMEILVQEERFKNLVRAINYRSKYHAEVIQPLLEEGGFREGEPFLIADLEQHLGARNTETLRRLTDEIIEFTDETIVSLQETGEAFKARLDEWFPKYSFFRFEAP